MIETNFQLCKKNKIKLYFDIFGKLSLKQADQLNSDGIKIHPTDINNFELIYQIRSSKIKKIFLESVVLQLMKLKR